MRMEEAVGTAILGMDTLWGGDAMCASGTGRFIADSWFGDEPLPEAYTLAEAAAVRASGGVSAKTPDRAAIDAYLAKVDIPGAIEALKGRGEYLAGLALCFETMWDLAMEILGRGARVPYDRCVLASCAQAPEASDPREKRDRVAALLDASGDLPAAGRPSGADGFDPAAGGGSDRPFRRADGGERDAAFAGGVANGAAGEYRISADSGRLVFGIDELPGTEAAAGREPGIRGHL